MKSFSNLRFNISEKTLTAAEKKKREEIAKAIERDNPDMPMAKKMAIATSTAKKVAEEQEAVTEETIHVGYRNSKGVWIKTSTHSNYPAAEKAMNELEKQGKKGVQHRYDNKGNIDPGTHNFRKVDEEQEAADMATLRKQLDKHTELAIKANRAGDDTGTMKHQGHIGKIKDKMAKLVRSEEVELDEGDQGILWRVEKSEATGRFHAVKGYNKSRKIWKNKYGASDHTSEEEAKARVDKLNQGVAEAIIKQPPKKMDIPAAIRKAQGGNWKTTTQDIEKDKLRNVSSPESLAAGRKKEGMVEANDKQTWPGHSDTVKNPNFNDELSIRRISPPGKRLKSGKLDYNERTSQERTKTLMKYTQKKGGLTGPKGPLPEEVELDESKMAELHSDIADMMDKHISKYNKVGGSEALMAKVDPAAKKLAAMHGIEHAAARRHISSYIDTQIKEENSLSEVNDYFKRRAKEEGIIAGTKPARKAPKKAAEPMSDYSKRRAKEGSGN